MKGHFNPFSMANTISMTRGQFRGVFLLVEGDTDSRFFSNLTSSGASKIIPAYGKDNVIQTIVEINKRGTKGVIGIVDADFWHVEGFTIPSNLFVTDTHDIETMIIFSPALEKVLREFVPGEKLEHIENLGSSIRQVLLKIGLSVGCLRWVSLKEQFRLSFDSLPYSQFVDSKNLSVDLSKMVKSVRVASKDNIPLNDREIIDKLNSLISKQPDPWQICQGHDLVCILEIMFPIVLEKFLGREIAENARRKAHADALDKNLRVGYETSFFVKTQLYISIKSWEEANRPYVVFDV